MVCSSPRQELLVIGIGNTLREDDGVGIELVSRLREHFNAGLNCLEVYEPDIVLAETIAEFDDLLIIDALVIPENLPFKLVPLSAGESFIPAGGFLSHVFDWGVILALSRDLFGGPGEAKLLGISASSFGLSERLSAQCAANAEEAFRYLLDYCSAVR
jgi:hydrogenase maturation protease